MAHLEVVGILIVGHAAQQSYQAILWFWWLVPKSGGGPDPFSGSGTITLVSGPLVFPVAQ